MIMVFKIMMIEREANDVLQWRWMGDDGESAANRHDQGEKEESEGVQRCDGFQDVVSNGWERGSREKECKGKVSENSHGEEKLGGAKSLTFNPSKMKDFGVAH